MTDKKRIGHDFLFSCFSFFIGPRFTLGESESRSSSGGGVNKGHSLHGPHFF